ncbi:MAG: hypothetical protein AAGH89_01965 [Verrucomicrobiota bacterium]
MKEILGGAAILGALILGGFFAFSYFFSAGVDSQLEAESSRDVELERAMAADRNRDEVGFWKPGTMPEAKGQKGMMEGRSAYNIERVFTNREGTKITAILRGKSPTHVRLEAGGNEYRYPIADLSDADREFLKKLDTNE